MSTSPNYRTPSSLLHARPLTLGEILSGALLTGFKGALLLSVLLAVLVGGVGLARGDAPRFISLASLAGWTFLVSFILCFLIGMLKRSRPMQNGAFTCAGFLATFFGVAMLVVFFWGLLTDVGRWLYYTPILVDMKNQENLQLREELKKTEALRDAKKIEIDKEFKEALEGAGNDAEKKELTALYLGSPERLKELAAAEEAELAKASSDGERQKIRQRYDIEIRAVGGVYGESLRVFDGTIADRKSIADMPLRDTSVWGVLSYFLFANPSNEPESVGIRPALLGSLWLAVIMMLFAVPIGVGAALYLEEYKTSGRLARIIQTNINNLAGVPSIVYGILGAFVFVELIFKPMHVLHEGISVRNVLGGGLTLGLLTLPVIIVSAQEAIRTVPNSIRHGAYALGATHWQCIWHQVLPLARPGIMTGTILAVSRAIGEAAPLVLFGATTYIAYSPNPFSEFTVLPIQIYNWAERPTNPIIDGAVIRQWNFNMALASLVLMMLLLCLNGVAIYLRQRAQKKVQW